MERILIFLAGEYWNTAFYKKNIKKTDYIIGADEGNNFLFKIKKLPNLIVGDLDSISQKTSSWISKNKIQIKKYRKDKDYTDSELALALATKLKPKKVVIFGGFGSRRDHEYSTLMIASKYSKSNTQILLENESQLLFFAQPGKKNKIPSSKGQTISLIPFNESAEKVTTMGLLYPLKKGTLFREAGRGVSNIAIADNPTVYVAKGKLLVVVNKGS